jgi:hypothetical protein
MPTKDINDCVEPIRDHWEEIKRDFFPVCPGYYLTITCAHRSPAEQFELYKKGRTMGMDGNWVVSDKKAVVTNAEGYKVLSAHNYYPARGLDVAVVNNQTGEVTWDERYYKPLIDIVSKYGLVEGGSWRVLKDWPHIEIPDYKNYKGA